jgi:hypothetical protein
MAAAFQARFIFCISPAARPFQFPAAENDENYGANQ